MSSRREIIVAFRITAVEAARVDAAAAKRKAPPYRTRSDWCRAAALHMARAMVPEPVKPRRRPARHLPALDTQLLSRIMAQAGRLSGSLNQIARWANVHRDAPAVEPLRSAAADVRALRDAVESALRGGDPETPFTGVVRDGD